MERQDPLTDPFHQAPALLEQVWVPSMCALHTAVVRKPYVAAIYNHALKVQMS